MKNNIVTLREVLKDAEAGHYAVGSFSPRYTPLIGPILNVAQKNSSPVIVQISQRELILYGITPGEFAGEFYKCVEEKDITVPVVLHLDHTKEINLIKKAVDAGFKSVMIDASEKKLDENIAITAAVVEYAKKFGVSVEAELGKIGTTDFVESDNDEEMYTVS
ncbi:class II fructose-bisphosphate aldolase [Petroclostridium xylanilyticum]|uniref:class II fructose-bisphosphate aldolase n=1 Tax=Petroclostridium xylanilyticum TaxID=1792311 RepID=UPI000B994511|nr:class II fructose-bisphosphate aldolase [Petroclostridium xylanilyticum]